MTIEHKRAYLEEIRWRYQKSTKSQKTKILDEFCEVCKYDRKHAIKILRGQLKPRVHRPGPQSKYGNHEFLLVLIDLWVKMNKICSKKMVAAFPKWLPHYHTSHRYMELLNTISASTIDRLLKPIRKPVIKGFGTTRPSLVKSRIPLKLIDGDIKFPGYIEADTVSHCGSSVSGEFISSLTMTDLYSGWTENRAIWTKSAINTKKGIAEIEEGLPFTIIGFASDNGTEFLNEEVYKYLKKRTAPINMVRRRPYKKNDSAHVEQKNWTHVRELFGYQRYENEDLVQRMNEIYKAFWNPLLNYFTPVLKLKEKIRIGGKIKKKYDEPTTPCDRLLKSSYIPQEDKNKLEQKFKSMNPFTLKKMMDEKLKEFFKLADEYEKKRLISGS